MKIGSRLKELQRIAYMHKGTILKSFSKSWNNINISQSEPYIIHDYIISKASGIKYLNKTIPPVFRNYGFIVKFAGVFIHQKPIIQRKNTACAPRRRNCELGDLLTLFLFVDSSKNILLKKAFISQAKKNQKNIHLKNCQTCLYEKEQEFTYYRFKTLNGAIRRLPTYPKRYFSLNYLILSTNKNIIDPFIIPPSFFEFTCKFKWNFVLFNTLIGCYGLNFGNNSGNGWSKIIWDLINVTGSSLFGKRGHRANYLNELLNYFNDFDNYEKTFLETEDEYSEGIPMLLIIIQDKEIKLQVKQ